MTNASSSSGNTSEKLGNMKRYLAITLPFAPSERIRREWRRSGGDPQAETPLVLTIKERGALRLHAVDAQAGGLGLRPGQALADARAMHPGLVVADADPEADKALLVRLNDWARRYTPLAAIDPPDGLVLDIAGSTHLFGGEKALLDDAVSRLGTLGFTARAAIAGTPEAAAALARARPNTIVPPGEEEHALRPLPLRALRIDPQALSGLERLGLKRVEDVLLRPRAPFAARFGEDLIERLDAALGRVRSSIGARIEAPSYVVERRFFEPILNPEDVTRTLHRLADELCAMLLKYGEGALALEMSLFRVDGVVRRIHMRAARPTRDPERIALLFREKLAGERDELDVGYGFDVVRLIAVDVDRLDETMTRLDGRAAGEDLARLVDALGARLGPERVRVPAPRDSHQPEEASGLAAPGLRLVSSWLPPPPGAPADRPIRLFERPEPIEAIASVPDGPPLRFRWRRLLHETIAYEGPERIAASWWEGEGHTRDYFRTEDRTGRRFWLFRQGLFGREVAVPRWYVHGLFS
jgi:protein ImuB